MNERDFFYWLQGFFELTGAEKLDKKQVKMVKEHMQLVAIKVTPGFSNGDPSIISIPTIFGPSPNNTNPFAIKQEEPVKVEITCNDKPTLDIQNRNVTYCATKVNKDIKCEVTC